MVRHFLASVALFAVVFIASWFGTFFVLYEYVYGDSYGGRWSRFAWPVALAFATSAVLAFVSRVVRRDPVRLRTWALGASILILAAVAWIFIGTRLLLPPLR